MWRESSNLIKVIFIASEAAGGGLVRIKIFWHQELSINMLFF